MRKLLIIEDDQVDQLAFERFVKKHSFPFNYTVVSNIYDATQIIQKETFDVIVSDYFLGDGTAFEILTQKPDAPIIVVTGTGSEEIAVDAMKRGAFDYIIKDIEGNYLKILPATIENALRHYKAQKELNEYHEKLEKKVEKRTAQLNKELEARIKAEAQLKKLSVAVEQNPSIILITDTNGIIEYVNPKGCEISGYTFDELAGQNVTFLSADSEQNLTTVWNTIEKGDVWEGEFINRTKNGETYWEAATISPIFNDEGKIVNYVKVADDITRKKRFETIQQVTYHISNAVSFTINLEELLGIVKKELSQIIDTTNFFIAFYDEENDTFYAPIFDDERDQLASWPAKKSLSGRVVKKVSPLLVKQKEIEDLIASGEIDQIGEMSKVWLGVPLLYNGKAKGIFAIQNYENENALTADDLEMMEFVASQISRALVEKQMEQSLKESEKRFKQLFGSLGDAVFVTKIGTADRGKIIEVNPAAEKQTGYSRNELLKMNIIRDLKVDNQDDISTLDWEKKILGGKIITTVEQKRRKDGSTYWDEVIVTPFDIENESAVLSINHDITTRIKVESELKQALEKATESDRLKSAFLANMSHEIRTPMNGILGFAALLKENDLSADTQKTYIDIIEKSGLRMLNTINDIIDISRIESGQVELNIHPVNLNKELIDQYRFFKPEADKKAIQFILKTELNDELASYETDGKKLNAIFTNLIKNALKYTKEGKVEFGYRIKNGHPEFYVSDTGIGIPENRQQAIFDRFIQADIEDRDAYEGSGLGLAISKAYVEMLGGEIMLKSEPGKGSEFCFTIAGSVKQKTPDKKQIEPIIKKGVEKKLNLLIADDDEIAQLFLEKVLKDYPKQLFKAKHGKEVLDILKKHPEIDIILMDIKMPVMDGLEATKKIRESNKNIIIIAQTAYALQGDKELALEAGCNDYISKPIKRDELLSLINKYSS